MNRSEKGERLCDKIPKLFLQQIQFICDYHQASVHSVKHLLDSHREKSVVRGTLFFGEYTAKKSTYVGLPKVWYIYLFWILILSRIWSMLKNIFTSLRPQQYSENWKGAFWQNIQSICDSRGVEIFTWRHFKYEVCWLRGAIIYSARFLWGRDILSHADITWDVIDLLCILRKVENMIYNLLSGFSCHGSYVVALRSDLIVTKNSHERDDTRWKCFQLTIHFHFMQ